MENTGIKTTASVELTHHKRKTITKEIKENSIEEWFEKAKSGEFILKYEWPEESKSK